MASPDGVGKCEAIIFQLIRRLQAPVLRKLELDEDIVYARSDTWLRDERTGMNEPLVYELYHQVECSVAMFGRDKR